MTRARVRARTARAHRPSGHRGAAGFTLLEIVLATALLALGLALAYATLRTTTLSAERGEALAARSEQVRAVQTFLRRQLGGALSLPFERTPQTTEAVMFSGGEDEVSFTATMPGYLARGGAYKQTLRLVPDGEHRRLEFDYHLLLGDTPVRSSEQRPPEVLLRDIVEARFEFRGAQADGQLGEWTTQWESPSQLPLLARLQLRFADPRRRWPELEVPLLLSAAVAGGAAGANTPPPLSPNAGFTK